MGYQRPIDMMVSTVLYCCVVNQLSTVAAVSTDHCALAQHHTGHCDVLTYCTLVFSGNTSVLAVTTTVHYALCFGAAVLFEGCGLLNDRRLQECTQHWAL